MRNIEEFLDERELYIYRNHPAKSFKMLGEEFGVSGTRISQIKERAIRKIRYEKRRAIAHPWYEEEIKLQLRRKELFLLRQAISDYRLACSNTRWEHQKGIDTDPEYELCGQIYKKLDKAIAHETHPRELNLEEYQNPNIDDGK